MATATLAQVPRLRRKVTAFTFLTRTLPRVIEEDHRRMRMRYWRTPEALLLPRERPACGMVGCIGGWTDVLTGNNADVVLGLTCDQRDELCYDGPLCMSPNQGTARHASAVIAHLRQFAAKYKAQLQQTVIPPYQGKG